MFVHLELPGPNDQIISQAEEGEPAEPDLTCYLEAIAGHFPKYWHFNNQAVSGEEEVRYQEKVLRPEGGRALEQAPQGNGHSTKPHRAQ